MTAAREPIWLTKARDEIGLREIKGPQHEPRILELAAHARVGWIRDDETAWCSTFACGILEECRIVSPRDARARSFTHWGVDVLANGIAEIPLGAILVFSRPPNPDQGHVGFAVGRTKSGDLRVVGGNQGDAVSIATFAGSRLIAARWPIEWRADIALLNYIPLVDAAGALSTNEA